MAWIATLVTIPVTAKASAIIGKSQEEITSTIIEGHAKELNAWNQTRNLVIKTLVQIMDDPSTSDAMKLRAANVVLNHGHGSPLGPYTWRRLVEINKGLKLT